LGVYSSKQTDFRGVVGLQFGAAAGNTYVSIPFIPQVDRQTDTERDLRDLRENVS